MMKLAIAKEKKRIAVIAGFLAVLALTMVALVTVYRLRQMGTEPVAPSAPKSKPRAEEPVPTPGPDSACRKTWTIAAAALTPTLTPTTALTPTETPTLTLTPTPAPTESPPPDLTPLPTVVAPTAIPTVGEAALPEAGGIGQTLAMVLGGWGIILLGWLIIW